MGELARGWEDGADGIGGGGGGGAVGLTDWDGLVGLWIEGGEGEVEGEGHTMDGKGERGWKGSQGEKDEGLHGSDSVMDVLGREFERKRMRW